jgi:hypothetical protein
MAAAVIVVDIRIGQKSMDLESLDNPHEGVAAAAADERKDLAQRDGATAREPLDQEVDQLGDIVALKENPRGAALEDDATVVNKRLQAEQPIACLVASGERVIHQAATFQTSAD